MKIREIAFAKCSILHATRLGPVYSVHGRLVLTRKEFPRGIMPGVLYSACSKAIDQYNKAMYFACFDVFSSSMDTCLCLDTLRTVNDEHKCVTL